MLGSADREEVRPSHLRVPGGACPQKAVNTNTEFLQNWTLTSCVPAELMAPYSAPVYALICKECGYIELYAALPRLLCDWLEKR